MNCIMIVLDSLDYTRVQESNYDLLPFLKKQSAHACYTTNMYSEAPYTEAAAIALYGGQHTLNNNGYMKRFRNIPKIIFESFEDEGFDVFFNSFQPQCFPSSLRRGINHIYYNRAFDPDALWSYRLSYYSLLQKKNAIDDKDYVLLSEILDDNFSEWIHFLNDMISRDTSTELIASLNKSYDLGKALQEVTEEYAKFKNNNIVYIKELLNQGKTHSFFATPYYKQIDFGISDENRERIDSRCRKLFSRINRKNLASNLLYNKDLYTQTLRAFCRYCETRNKGNFLESMYLIKNTIFPAHFKDRFGKSGPMLKGQPSFHTLSRHLLQWIDTRDSTSPFFACLHIDDIHFPEVFYTYDTNDLETVMEDLDIADEHLKKRKNDALGTLIHDLSLLYADHQFELLHNEIKKRNLDNNTIYIITADHGFSYSGYPIRNKAINTFYLENFKIPFWAFGPGITEQRITSLQSSVSIPQTICELMKIETFDSYEPSIFNSNNGICLIEYCGGGCPDLRRREIMLAAFNEKKMIAFISSLENDFSETNIVEVYDLIMDPKQRRNLVNTYNHDEYSSLILALSNRFNELKLQNE